MSLKVRLASKRKPAGWELIEEPLMQFEERLREAVDDPHEGKRKCEATWPIHRIHYERNRFIYDMYYRQQRISRDLYEFLVREKVVDASLISKWRKPGYEILCSMAAIQKSGTNFGTTSICRVPLAQRGGQITVRTCLASRTAATFGRACSSSATLMLSPCTRVAYAPPRCAAECHDGLRQLRLGRRHRWRPRVVD